MDFNRRHFFKILAGAIPASTEVIAASSVNISESPLSLQEIEESKERAAESLYASLPSDTEELNYLRKAAEDIFRDESQMYVPSRNELEILEARASSAIVELAGATKPNGYGLLIFSDLKDAKHFQRLYVLKRLGDGKRPRVQCIKAYAVSASANGFGNEMNSGKTPLGMHQISETVRGVFGQVVSGLNKHRHLFNRALINGEEKYFVRSFGAPPQDDDQADIAEVVTDQYLLTGPRTPAERGIRIHGTNRSGMRNSNGNWITFLGGKRRSGGCIRMSNLDVRDLSLSGYIQTKNPPPVMIVATQESIATTQKEKPRWLIEY